MEDLDLDALRAARAEANGTGGTITFGGRKFKLPPEWSYEAALDAAVGDMQGALAKTFGEKEFKRFMALQPTVQDITALAEYLQQAYGRSEGESSASSTSS